eukprot:CAMPEP_0119009436 /NCGR_PEP_ID=MMETSP1176-20130426/4361_1 /TAXON_ID=265551 /ORGANISM="Synedropsis recta cf, Strain CCMP1620" /LENGTH=592 /DNA_ID=CAMNT_0006961953 /DNA_START=57 /DNA_END=1835 /DNA_ORIENTATION=+
MFWANSPALKTWRADSLEELLGRNFKNGMSEATKRRMDDQLAQLRRGEIMTEEWTSYPKNRKPTTLGLTGTAIRIDGGRIAALIEAELPDSKKIDQSSIRGVEMLRHLPLAVCKFDMKGKKMYQNPEAVNLFGSSEESTFVSRFVDRAIGKTALQQVQGGNDYKVETELYTQSGPRWFAISVRRAKDPVTGDHIVLDSVQDITEIIQARKESKQASLKSEFTAVMAHEIRTPLHQIIGYMDLLELTTLSGPQLENVRMVQDSTALLIAIINDLLDYSKLEEGRLQLENMSFDSRGILDGCIAAVEPECEQKGLKLVSMLLENLPHKLKGDPNRFRQIILNLLQNAVKFTDEGSVTMSVTTVSRDELKARLRFEIVDTGVGIDPSHQTIIFEKYRQAHASVARNYGGTGLGLAICKSLTEAMGGVIGLESELGKGTKVFVEIPFDLPKNGKKRTRQEKGASSAEEVVVGLRILVAEDNKVNQKMVRAMLTRIGHKVTVADNGQLAVDELQKSVFDLVLMDVQMPVMDGIEATKQIRNIGRTKSDLPVVGLTASYQHSDLQYYKDIGMNDCLGKPVRLNHLKKAIENARKGASG